MGTELEGLQCLHLSLGRAPLHLVGVTQSMFHNPTAPTDCTVTEHLCAAPLARGEAVKPEQRGPGPEA